MVRGDTGMDSVSRGLCGGAFELHNGSGVNMSVFRG